MRSRVGPIGVQGWILSAIGTPRVEGAALTALPEGLPVRRQEPGNRPTALPNRAAFGKLIAAWLCRDFAGG